MNSAEYTSLTICDIPIVGPIRTTALGRCYANTEDGREWTKSRNGDWTPHASTGATLDPVSIPPLQVLLVLEHQSEGEPKHWSFFLAREGEKGSVCQVTGDAEMMHYVEARDVAHLGSPSLAEAILIKDDIGQRELDWIKEIFTRIPPPSAASAADVRRNCQTWCVVVLKRLVELGLVDHDKVDAAMARLEPVRGRTPVID